MKTYSLSFILSHISNVPFFSDSFFGTEVTYKNMQVESTCGTYIDFISSKSQALELISDYVKANGKTWEQ